MERWPPQSYLKEARRRRVPEADAQACLSEAHQVQLLGLPAILSLEHLAQLSGVGRAFLERIVHREAGTAAYRSFNMKKRGSVRGYRRIHVPHPALRRVQSWLVKHLLHPIRPHSCAYGYVKGLKDPIVNCARLHCGASWLVRMDIEEFFHSISEVEVFRFFSSLGYCALVSFELARLCTWDHEPNQVDGTSTQARSVRRIVRRARGVGPGANALWPLARSRKRYLDGSRWLREPGSARGPYGGLRIGSLPQGAPTSPMLANLIFSDIDMALMDLADSMGFCYNRYADDLFFSAASATRTKVQSLRRAVSNALRVKRLRLASAKTHVSPPGARKVVLGLLVDGDHPRLTRETRASIRQHIHSIGRHPELHRGRRNFSSVWALIQHVRGLVGFAASVQPALGEKYNAQLALALQRHRLDVS